MRVARRPSARLRRRTIARAGPSRWSRGPVPAATPRGAGRAAAAALVALLAYAVLRYAVHGREPLASVPLWMTNKAVAVLAVALVAAASVRPAAPWRGWARSAGLAAAALHAVASLALLRPGYQAAMFEGGPAGRMSAAGELAILCGSTALVVFVSLGWPRVRPDGGRTPARWLAIGGGVLVAVHCASFDLPRWLEPLAWPGGLPPMSLLGALLALLPVGVALVAAVRGRAVDPRPSGRRAPSR